MLQEESNGETSFEIVDKKIGESSNNGDKTDSLSSISSAYSVPSPSALSGNLLSNVAPPASLPDFTLWPSPTSTTVPSTANVTPQAVSPTPQTTTSNPVLIGEQFPTTQFSAAIPPSKAVLYGPTCSATENEKTGGGIMNLMKEAFSSGGVLSKMAEKAKSSVDSIITTLDPQMSEYIYSGGDTEVTVTSENEDEISAIREAFHSVFGKAWVNGIKLSLPPKKSLAVGFDEGIKFLEEKIDYSLKYRKTPTVGLENTLLQCGHDWYYITVLLLKDPERNLRIQTFSQPTPIIGLDKLLKEIDASKPECKDKSDADKLAVHLKANPNWRHSTSGLTDKEIVLLAAKTLVRIFKSELA